jgi:hypothetical protein
VNTGVYAVVDARGGLWALEREYRRARRAREAVLEHLDGAATCGHSMAVAWVDRHLPLRTLWVSRDEAERMREDETPRLEREP